MTFDIRHLLVYLCAALLAVAPGLAWGESGEKCVRLVEIKDFKAAYPVCKTAAEQGSTEAQFELGAMYYKGEGVTENPQEAYAWFLRAAYGGIGEFQEIILHLTVIPEMNSIIIFIFGALFVFAIGILRYKLTPEKWREKFSDIRERIIAIHVNIKIIIFIPAIPLFGWGLLYFIDTIDRKTVTAFVLGSILAVTIGMMLHFKWARKISNPFKRKFFSTWNATRKLSDGSPRALKPTAYFVSKFMPAALFVGFGLWLFIGKQVFALMGAIIGPFLAVLATTWLHEKWTKKERRQKLFNTLVATKKYALSHNRAQALNEVKLEFNEKSVEDAWDNFVDYMELPEKMREQEREESLYDDLLHRIADALDDKSRDIKRSFAPEAHRNLERLDANLKTSLLKILTGEEPIAIRGSKRKVAEALYIQGIRFRDGDGVLPNPRKAVRLLVESANKDWHEAQKVINFLLDGQDKKEAKKWDNAPDRQMLAKARNHLGVMYVDRDLKQAEALFEMAAEKGLDVAQYNLGLVYAQQDNEKAKEWFEKSAKQGFADAHYLLGLIKEGSIDSDMEDKNYLHQSAVLRDSENVNVLILGGNNPVKAALIFRKFEQLQSILDNKDEKDPLTHYVNAAIQGHAKAQNKLENLAYKGDTTVQRCLASIYANNNPYSAYVWLLVAERGQNMEISNDTLTTKKKIEEDLSEEQVSKATSEADSRADKIAKYIEEQASKNQVSKLIVDGVDQKKPGNGG